MTGSRDEGLAPDRAAGAVDSGPGRGQEIEIKFAVSHAGLARVLAAPALKGAAISPERELQSVYFDTAERNLRDQGLTLRLRRKGRSVPILGVKWKKPGALFARGEIEVPAPDGEPDIGRFEPALREQLEQAVQGRPLVAVFKTHVKRRTAVLRHGRSDIELALDDGLLLANDHSLPLVEVEFELKSGNAADLVSCARQLALECGLSLQFESKSSRGYRLADGAAAGAEKAQLIALPGKASFDDLMFAVLSNSLAHFTANWAALRESDDPEAVHQLRVALRRLRSALGIFCKRITLPELVHLRAEARRIGSGLGPARECDVFRQNTLAGPLRDEPSQLKAAARFLEAVERRRKESYAAARLVLDHPATSLFVLDAQAFLAERTWRKVLAPHDLALLTASARTFAAEVLERLRRQALKRGKRLPDMTDAERHELRIVLKKLRYAAEFFGSLFPGRKAVRLFLRDVADLQEGLGAQNDAAVAEHFIASLDLPPEPHAHFVAGYVLGYDRHAVRSANTHLLTQWKRFRKSEVFWW